MNDEISHGDIHARIVAVEKDVGAVERDIGLLRDDLKEDRERSDQYRTANAKKVGEIHDYIVTERANRAQTRRIFKVCAATLASIGVAVGVIKGLPLDGNGK